MKKTKETKCQKSSNNTVKSSKLSFVFRPFSSILLVLRRLEFLGLYSYLKIQPSLGRRSSSFQSSSSIKRLAKLRITGYFATMALLFLSFATISPIYIKHAPVEAESGTATPSTLTFTSIKNSASVNLNVTSKDGTFATSTAAEMAQFSISTNNYTGYTLVLETAGNLTLNNTSTTTNTISPITNTVTKANFSANDTAGKALNNKWGITLNYYDNTPNNTGDAIEYYQPAASMPIRTTSAANTIADTYTIGLGLRADYTNPSGTYTNNTFILEYVANKVDFTLTYSKGTISDEVEGIPATIYEVDSTMSEPTESGNTSTYDVTHEIDLEYTDVPTRSGYDFVGWCDGSLENNGTECNGTPGKLYKDDEKYIVDENASSVTLYAVWEREAVTLSTITNMQDMTSAICAASEEHESKQLKDTRDGKLYWVTKLKDGNCWMTQNLDLGDNGMEDMTLTPTDSDVATNFALTAPGSLDFSSDNYDVINYRDPGEQYYVSSGSTSNDTSYTSKSACEAANSAELCQHSHAGNYYNWYTATAGTGTQDVSTKGEEATSSICPKGWQMPVGDENTSFIKGLKSYSNLLSNYDIWSSYAMTLGSWSANGFNNIRNNPLYFVRSGSYTTASLGLAALNGYYWSSTASSGTNAYALLFNSGYVTPQNNYNKYNGHSVRCLARNIPVSLVVAYDKNTTATVSNLPANQTMTNFDGQSTPLTISSAIPARSDGYGLAGWSTNPNADSPEFQPGESRYLSTSEFPTSSELKLYAIWSNKTYSITYDANGGTGSGFPWTDTSFSRSMPINFSTKPTAPSSKEFKGWSTDPAATTTEYVSGGTTSYIFPDGEDSVTLYAVWGAACIIEGTPVNLPNGQKAPVESIADWQEGIAWDFENGTPTTAAFTPIDKDTTPAEYNVIYLHFSDGKKIGIVDEHWFFDADANQFVEFNNNNAEEYIGHHFVKVDGESWATNELVEVTRETKVTTVYSPTTYEHVNFVVDDMLSMAGDLRGLFNYFEVDPITMAWDPVKKANDINKYGLTTLADFNGKIDQAAFDAFNVRYFNVSIGKGLMTWNTVDYYIEKYLPNLYMER